METRITDRELSAISRAYESIKKEISRYVVGNQEILGIIFIRLLAEGHVLVEGIPGTAKSTLVKATAQLMGCDFRRVQCGIDTQPDDMKQLAPFAFPHRLLLTREAEISGISPARVVREILASIGVP
jgi:MoxR-like ATPase